MCRDTAGEPRPAPFLESLGVKLLPLLAALVSLYLFLVYGALVALMAIFLFVVAIFGIMLIIRLIKKML